MSKNDEHLEYVPSPVVSEWFTEEFNKLVLLCPNGIDRKLRFSWGMDRLEFCGGHWERRYGDTQNTPQKYVGRDCWVIEGWQPPDMYDRDEWEKQKHLLGEWPANGVWDFIAFHTDNKGGYLPLDQSALNHIQIWAHWQGKTRKESIEEVLSAKFELRKARYQERKKAADAVAAEFGATIVKHFDRLTNPVTTSGKGLQYATSPGGIIIPTN